MEHNNTQESLNRRAFLKNTATMSVAAGVGATAASNAFGQCSADLNNDGVVNSTDLASVLAAWGDCPIGVAGASCVNIMDYGSLQDAVAALPDGGDVVFPLKGSPYIMSPTEINTPGIRLIGQGSGYNRPILHWQVLGPQTAGLTVRASGFEMHSLRLFGPKGTTFVGGEDLVRIPDDGSATAASRFKGLRVINCDFRSCGGAGLRVNYTNEIHVIGCTFAHLGHIGAMFLSCDWGWFERNTIKHILPGTLPDPDKTNAYGVSLTHTSGGWPDTEDERPFCANWWIHRNYIEDIPWEGIDGHGGWNIHITDNVVRNTKYGISSTQSSCQAEGYAGGPCWVTNNYIICDYGDSNKNRGYAINVSGGTDRSSLGAIVSGNRIFGKGRDGANGAILIGNCSDTRVESNYLDEIGGAGVVFRGSSVLPKYTTGRVRIAGNTFGDKSTGEGTLSNPVYAINIRQNSNRTIQIANNHLFGLSRPLSGLRRIAPGVTSGTFETDNYVE